MSLSEHSAEKDVAAPTSWAYGHAAENPGHSTYHSLSDPGRCLTCGEKSPAYALPTTRVISPA